MGVSQTTITRILNDTGTSDLSFTFILRLSEATGIYLLDLVAMIYPDTVNDTSPAPSARVLAQQISSLPASFQDAITALIIGTGSMESDQE